MSEQLAVVEYEQRRKVEGNGGFPCVVACATVTSVGEIIVCYVEYGLCANLKG